jgi:chromosome segregation ATPase
MSDDTLDRKVSEIEGKVHKLEIHYGEVESRLKKLDRAYENEVQRMTEILQKIEHRLVGSIDRDTPGLITDVKYLKDTVSVLNVSAKTLSEDLSLIRQTFSGLEELRQDNKEIWKKVRLFEKYRWIIVGVLLTSGYLLSKVVDWAIRHL